MNNVKIIVSDPGRLKDFKSFLILEEKSIATTEKYIRDVRRFLDFKVDPDNLSKNDVINYKYHLVSSNYKPSSINSMLAAVSCYLRFLGREDCIVKAIKMQQRTFRPVEKELTLEEYYALLDEAEKKNKIRLKR